jgi:hypothetical protein
VGKAARRKAERRRAIAARQTIDPVSVQSSYPVEHQAAHEAGHGVVQWTLGLPFDCMSLDTKPPGVWPLAGVKQHLGDKWLIGAAGCIADYQSRNLMMHDVDILKLILGSPDGRFALVDSSGAVTVRPDRLPAVIPGADLHLMATVMGDQGNEHPWPAPEIIGIWRDCEKYVAACRPVVKQVAAELLVARSLTYAETVGIATDAMTGVPRPSVPEWFEDAYQLSRRLEAEALLCHGRSRRTRCGRVD